MRCLCGGGRPLAWALAAACTLHARADQEKPVTLGQAGQPCPHAPCLTATDLPGVSTKVPGPVLCPVQNTAAPAAAARPAPLCVLCLGGVR